MILPDHHIEEELLDGDLVIDPITNRELQIQPGSVDLRLGGEVLIPWDGVPVDPKNPVHENRVSEEITEDGYKVNPGDFLLATTKERVEIPNDMLGQVGGRSSMGRLGITIHSTAGIIDPGYEGQITLEISNEGVNPVHLYEDMRICQLVLHAMTGKAERPYGDDRGSKYQNQSGVQRSEVKEDSEFG